MTNEQIEAVGQDTRERADKALKPFLFRKVTPNLINTVTALLAGVIEDVLKEYVPA